MRTTDETVYVLRSIEDRWHIARLREDRTRPKHRTLCGRYPRSQATGQLPDWFLALPLRPDSQRICRRCLAAE